MLTKKDFTELATIVGNLNARHDGAIPARAIADALVTFCADSNPRFQPSTFRAHIDKTTDETLARWAARA